MRTRTRINLKTLILGVVIGLAMYYWGAAMITAIVMAAVIQMTASSIAMLFIVMADGLKERKQIKAELLAHQGLIQMLLHELKHRDMDELKVPENGTEEASGTKQTLN